MASSAGSTARRRKLGQLCAWGRVFAIKGLLAYLTVAKADFRSTCEASAGQLRRGLHPARHCDRERRLQPTPFVGKACMHASHIAYQEAARFACDAEDWMKGVVADAPFQLHAIYNSTAACEGVTLPTPFPTAADLEKIVAGCRDGYRATYKATFELLIKHLTKEFEVLEKLKLDEVVYDDVVEPAEAPVEYQEPEEINSMDAVIVEDLPPEDEGPQFLRAVMPDGSPVHVPVLDGLEREHSVVTFCRATMPHIGSACARHIMRHIDRHSIQPKTLEQLGVIKYT